MNIKGIGVDIEEVGRFRKLPYKGNQSFYKNIFTPLEVKYCLSKTDPVQHFAARFAAKEAVIKAVGGSVYQMREIEIVSDKMGRPSMKIKNQKGKFLISLSHTKNQAIAVALWLN